MCIRDLLGVPCDEKCGHLCGVLTLESLETTLRTRMPMPQFLLTEALVDETLRRCDELIKAMLTSQDEVETQMRTLEAEIKRIKSPALTHTVVSEHDLIQSLYGVEPCFSYTLRLVSVLPKVLYRFKPYRVVLELQATGGEELAHMTTPHYKIVPYASKLPVRALDASLITFDSVKVHASQFRVRVEIVNVKFQFTTKCCDFSHVCLMILHSSAVVKPVVLEGVHIRARKKPEQSLYSKI